MECTVEQLSRELRVMLATRYGDGEAAAMVRLIFSALKDWDATRLIINGDMPAGEWLQEKARAAAERVLGGEPIQYVLGHAHFHGMDLKVTPDVLIPRPETSELVDLIVSENPASDLRVLDVGTGSGAIAIALSRNLRFPEVTALDVSAGALVVARENAADHKVRIRFLHADIFTYSPDPGSFDIIVSNPPYIADSEKRDMEAHVLDHEPHSALFVNDANPLVFYSRIAEVGRTGLVAGGRLYFEINPRFAQPLEAMLRSEGYEEIKLIKDSYGKTRFAEAMKR